MKLSEIYKRNGELKISFEIFPPKNGFEGYQDLLKQLENLSKFNPSLVSLTYGAGGSSNNSTDLVKILSSKYNVMTHFTCICNSKSDVDEHVNEISRYNIENILALRGDIPEDKSLCKHDFKYANELVYYLKNRTNLSIGVAGYPEGHIDASDLSEDINNLKKKLDAGANAIFTQLFYDSSKFFKYLELLDKNKIDTPVIAGIMPILSTKQVNKMTSIAKISIPSKLQSKLEKYENSNDDLKKFGIDFVSELCTKLIENNVSGLHFYTLNKSEASRKILENIL